LESVFGSAAVRDIFIDREAAVEAEGLSIESSDSGLSKNLREGILGDRDGNRGRRVGTFVAIAV
jgi:hypothetical protein